MKKIISLFILAVICFSLTSCYYKSYSTNDANDFEKIYETCIYNGELALGFGEYKFNSYLCAFPRTAPKELTEFYFYHDAFFGSKWYFIYFVYHLESDEFSAFSERLSNFTMEYNGKSNSPIYDTAHFAFPTYIFRLNKSVINEECSDAEYIMLDEKESNIINIYINFPVPTEIKKENFKYNFLPNTMVWTDLIPEEKRFYGRDFSVYDFGGVSEDGELHFLIPDITEIEDQFLFATE